MLSVEAVIFDFDGVLVISNQAHLDVVRRTLRWAGIEREVRDEEIYKHFGKPYKEVLRGLMGEVSEDLVEKAAEYQLNFLHSPKFFGNVERIPGLRDFLLRLKRRGVRLGIATGNDEKFTELGIRELGLQDIFDSVVTVERVERPKPHPDAILKCLEELGVPRQRAIFVGDTKNDVLAAKRAGVKAVLVLTGAIRDPKGLGEVQPDFVLRDVLELEKLLQA